MTAGEQRRRLKFALMADIARALIGYNSKALFPATAHGPNTGWQNQSHTSDNKQLINVDLSVRVNLISNLGFEVSY